MSFLSILAERRKIEPGELSALEEKYRTDPASVERDLLERGLGRDEILKTKGEYYSIPTRVLGDDNIPFEVLKYVPEESARHYLFVPLAMSDGVLEVGIVDPDNVEARDALNFISAKNNLPFRVALISPSDFSRVLDMYRGLTGEVSKALEELATEFSEDELNAAVSEIGATPRLETGTKIIEDAPVTKIVATFLRYATEGNASDIHIEPTADRVRVRFRVDGTLYTSIILPSSVHPAVVARVKIIANIKLDEKRKPQDGRFSANLGGRRIDFRVSTLPTQHGEKVVIRILDHEKGIKSLDALGFRAEDLTRVRELVKRPYGLVLLAGPTGSGKTTTLYAMLNEIDREKKNVVSLEDPVEYDIPGANQSQVMPEIGYTFATGLRHTLRQDPDIVMVGEIRDKETAQLAIQAALTGHLVFSTVHTNTSFGVIPRLIDLGVDPFLIAPTLVMAIGQRLVRLLCPGGGTALPVDGSLKMMIDREFSDLPESRRKEIHYANEVYEAAPTPDCPSGTRGRVAVFEILAMNKELEGVVLKNPTEPAIKAAARAQGMLTFREDAILKAFDKVIPFEEVNGL